MKGVLKKAFGYQGDALNLPVADVEVAIPFYEKTLGFSVRSRSAEPKRSVVLARDEVTFGLAENGGDPTQDGCAFHVANLDALFAEFKANGLVRELGDFSIEVRNGAPWRVFYVVAPDGLCYWFGERQSTEALTS
ncbi:MAG: VOC family protein [Gemmatimonadota bacterium]